MERVLYRQTYSGTISRSGPTVTSEWNTWQLVRKFLHQALRARRNTRAIVHDLLWLNFDRFLVSAWRNPNSILRMYYIKSFFSFNHQSWEATHKPACTMKETLRQCQLMFRKMRSKHTYFPLFSVCLTTLIKLDIEEKTPKYLNFLLNLKQFAWLISLIFLLCCRSDFFGALFIFISNVASTVQ